jgi:hypothetical protein
VSDTRRISITFRLAPALLAVLSSPVLAVLPPPDFETGRVTPGDSAAPPRRFRVVQGDDLRVRLSLALDDARTRRSVGGFWVGYAFELRPGLRTDAARDDGTGLPGRGAGNVFFRYSAAGLVEQVESERVAVGFEDGRPAYWLGRALAGESIAHLRRVLDETADRSVASVLTAVIGRHGGPRVVPVLRDLARLSPRPEVREGAAVGLVRVPGQIGFVSGIVLDRRENPCVRRRIATELGSFGTAEGLRSLEAMAAVLVDEPVRRAVVEAAATCCRAMDEARLRQ